MAFVVCMVAVAPLRKEDAHRSEMISQLLFGELAEVLEQTKSFTRIRCVYDGYEGWCQSNQLITINDQMVANASAHISQSWSSIVELNHSPMPLTLGSYLGLFKNNRWQVGKFDFVFKGEMTNPAENIFSAESIRQKAVQYLHTAYLWGGRSVYGIDCSGFVQQVFRYFNKPLPRDAYQQAEVGELVGFLQEAVCGDLAFFDNEEGKIVHVGILFDAETIIHASGKVRIDKMDNMGIVNADTGERSHQLRIIKRYF